MQHFAGYLKVWAALLLVVGFCESVNGQVTTDSTSVTSIDSLQVPRQATDTLPEPRPSYSVSVDALDGPVTYSMRDSMRYNVAKQKIYLYGEATVAFQDVKLTAGQMIIDNANGIVTAEPTLDTAGVATEQPSFEQGPQKFTAQGLRYNFKTRKGVVYNATTQQGDLYVLGGRTKIVAADPSDPTRLDNTVYNSDAIITTCDLPHPHYGIRSNKQKVIPNKQVIVGPSQVELGGVPTPLWLPFGFFPIGSSERSGLIFPTDYTYTDIDGFGFQQVGWYFPWNDQFHSALTTDLFLKGTVRFNANNNYNKRYRYTGSANAGVYRNRRETLGQESFQNSYVLTWNHAQDRKANPYRTFSANVNFQTNDALRRNAQSYQSQVTNIIRSNVNYSIKFPDHPTWNLTTGIDQSLNTQTRDLSLNFPSARFSTGAFYPFESLGNDPSAWYKKANITYTAQARGTVNATDTTIFDAQPWREALLGAQHSATFSAPVTLAKYFRLSPNISATQTFFGDKRIRDLLTESIPTIDTIIIDGDTTINRNEEISQTIRDTLVRGFDQALALTASLSLSTRVYGTARFKLGPLRGIRHIMTPSVNIGYTPDYSRRPFRYYDDVAGDTESVFDPYLRFPTQPFSAGSLPDDLSLRVGYSLNNRLETKLQGRGDSVSRISTLLNNFRLSGSYNLAADSLQWSPISLSNAQFTFFDKIVRISFGGRLDVYAVDDAGRRINTTLLSQGKAPVRVEDFDIRLGAQFTLRQIRDFITGDKTTTAPDELFSLVDKFRVSYNYTRAFNGSGRNRGWTTSANSVNVSGSIPISNKWSIRTLTLGYDLRSQRLTYPSLSLGRDLHCWEMDFFWAPRVRAFTFSIRVKPSSLGFLELPYRRGNRF